MNTNEKTLALPELPSRVIADYAGVVQVEPKCCHRIGDPMPMQTFPQVDQRARLLPNGVFLAVALLIPLAPALGGDHVRWISAKDLDDHLDQSISAYWSRVPFREALQRLSVSQRLAVMIDRRVDPSQPLQLRLDHVPLRNAVEQMASSVGLGVSLLGPVAYFGPIDATRRLRTLAALRAEEVQHLSRKQQSTFNSRRPWNWPALSTPRQLLKQMAVDARMELRGIDQVPHDLWPEVQLPPLSLTDRLTLVTNGFDLTFRILPGGQEAELVPIQMPVALKRRYPLSRTSRDLVESLADRLSDAEFHLEPDGLVVLGRIEDHDRVAATLAGNATQKTDQRDLRFDTPQVDKTRYTLTIKNQPVGPLLRKLGERLKLKIQLDQSAIDKSGASLQTLVSFQVQNATLDELLEATLQPARLSFSRSQRVVKVGAIE